MANTSPHCDVVRAVHSRRYAGWAKTDRMPTRSPRRVVPATFPQLLRAFIASADRIKPHSLRHGFATEALAIGIPLQDIQDALGHRDPRTTRGYDRTRHNLDRSPAYALAQALRRS